LRISVPAFAEKPVCCTTLLPGGQGFAGWKEKLTHPQETIVSFWLFFIPAKTSPVVFIVS